MPFTPSHALVALPFIRTPLVPAAIAIGAMTPDVPLFVRATGLTYGFTHTIGNVVWTALLAFALFLVWRLLIRPATVEFVPSAIARRLPEQWSQSMRLSAREALGIGASPLRAAWLAISLLLGVASHILWDSFTHTGRVGVALIPALAEQWGPLTGFKWLQHGSSIVGLVALAVFALVWLRRRPVGKIAARYVSHSVRIAWWLALPVILTIALLLRLVAHGGLDDEFTLQHLAYAALPPAAALWLGLSFAMAVGIQVLRTRSLRR